MTDSELLIGPHRSDVMEQAVDDDLIVFDPSSESYYTLNRTAREVWELADGYRQETGRPIPNGHGPGGSGRSCDHCQSGERGFDLEKAPWRSQG